MRQHREPNNKCLIKTNFKIMKKLIVIAILLNISIASAQFVPFIEIGADPKMTTQGPYKGKPNDTNGGTLNLELKTGLEYAKQLYGIGYELHPKIKYEKWSVFYEHKFNNKILVFFNAKDFTTRIGPELSMIIRNDPPDDYRDQTKDWIQLGANFGVYYKLKYKGDDTGFEIGINYNIFRGEENYRKYADTFLDEARQDVMIILKRNF